MLWEVEIQPKDHDPEKGRVCEEYNLLTHSDSAPKLLRQSSRGYLLEGMLDRKQAQQLMDELLVDPLVETGRLAEDTNTVAAMEVLTILLKPGVMDPVAQSVLDVAQQMGIGLDAVRTFRRYYFEPHAVDRTWPRVLANDAIEQVVVQRVTAEHLSHGTPYSLKLVLVAIRNLDDAGLMKLSKDGQLSLSLDEMKTIRGHFRDLQRDPTDVELETIAQT